MADQQDPASPQKKQEAEPTPINTGPHTVRPRSERASGSASASEAEPIKEADAADLLSLWGGASHAKPQSAPLLPPSPTPNPSPTHHAPVQHVPPTLKPEPPKTELPPAPPVKPAPPPPAREPTPPARPPESFQATKKPAREPDAAVSHKDDVIEGEIVSGTSGPHTVRPRGRSEIGSRGPQSSKAELTKQEGEVINTEPDFLKIPTGPATGAAYSGMPINSMEAEPVYGEAFASQLDEFLAELHLSRKHIFYGIGYFVLLLVFIFGGFFAYRSYKNKNQSAPPPAHEKIAAVAVATTTEITAESTGIPSAESFGKITAPVSEEVVGETGIASVLSFGTEAQGASGLAQALLTLRRIQNAYSVDVYQLLNQATDRRARLLSHLALLRNLNQEGSSTLVELEQESNATSATYTEQTKKQDANDVNFFEQVRALNGQTAEQVLGDFISTSREIVTLRARFKALQKIEQLYSTILPQLERRIRDIDLNQDALIQGIKVYSVQGSDLNLIIPVGDQQGSLGSVSSSSGNAGFSAPAYPLLPINPAQVKAGHDYITQPGGGF